MWEKSSLLNTRVDNLQLGHFEQCSTKCKAAAGSSPPVVTFSCSCFVTVCAAAVCVGTIVAVLSQLNSLSKQSVKALVAIRFLSLLLERSLIQLLQAEAADKMLWVEFTEHGGDTSA